MLKVVKLMIKLFNRTVGSDIFSIWCFISTLDIKILENIKPLEINQCNKIIKLSVPMHLSQLNFNKTI